MQLSLNRDSLLRPLLAVAGVLERRQTMAVLSNVLFSVSAQQLTITGSDQEVELSACVEIDQRSVEDWNVTIPGKKLIDICKSLRPSSTIDFVVEENRVLVSSGRFKSHLVTMDAVDFPKVEMEEDAITVVLRSRDLNQLLDDTAFAMAQEDVRYFFNGMLMELTPNILRTVATNGQRLSMAETSLLSSSSNTEQARFIIPRKGIVELLRLVKDTKSESVSLRFSDNHLQIDSEDATMISKLIDGAYPDYERAIPTNGDKMVILDRLEFREALSRIAILTHEMYRNVRLQLRPGELVLLANNPQQEDAEETLIVDYQGEELEIGFNVGYLLDILSAVVGDKVKIAFSDGNSAAVLVDPESESSLYVVSPMML